MFLVMLIAGCATTGTENSRTLDGTWIGTYTHSTDSVEATLVIDGSDFVLRTEIADDENCQFISREYSGVVRYGTGTIEFIPRKFSEYGNALDVDIILANRGYRFYPFAPASIGTTTYQSDGSVLELIFVLKKSAPAYYAGGTHVFKLEDTPPAGLSRQSLIDRSVY